MTREEIERSAPAPTREVRVAQFVRLDTLDPKLIERPYYMGPGTDSVDDYFALVQAVARHKCAGIATWVMRQHSYVGALLFQNGYLMLITLRHADGVIPVHELDPPQRGALEAKERDLAGKLVEALSGEFNPQAYHDEYQQRVHELIESKRSGKKVKPRRVRQPRSQGSLVDSLRASLKGVTTNRRR